MGDSRDWTGSRLESYHLDRRDEDLDEPGGQLYAAHHVETGRPALVLVPEPGDHWAPRSDWAVRVTSQVSPPFVATELDRPPPPDAKALTDVDLVFINTAFTQPLEAQQVRSREEEVPFQARTRAMALVAGGLLLTAVVFWSRLLGSTNPTENQDDSSHVETMSWIDKQDSGSAVGYPMPDIAFPEQSKPPCEDGEVEMRGGCWMLLDRRAPCAKGTAEYLDKCYAPVRKKDAQPRSLKQ